MKINRNIKKMQHYNDASVFIGPVSIIVAFACPNLRHRQHHRILLLLLSASSQRDCACDEKAIMHMK